MSTKEFIISDEMRKAAQDMVCDYYEHDKYYRALSNLTKEAFAANPWCVAYEECKNKNGSALIHGSRFTHAEKAKIQKLFNDALNTLVSGTIDTLKKDGKISSSFIFKRKIDYYGAGMPPPVDNKNPASSTEYRR